MKRICFKCDVIRENNLIKLIFLCTPTYLLLFLFQVSTVFAKPEFQKYVFDKPIANTNSLGDYFYNKKSYPLAQIEYERAVLKNPKSKKEQTKLALSLLRQEKYDESIQILNESTHNSHLYLSMYAALKLGAIPIALSKQNLFLKLQKNYSKEKDEVLLLSGAIILENRKYDEAKKYYSKIQKESPSISVKKKSGAILSSILEYEKTQKKNAALSGFLAAIFPGSGHFYTEHYTDGAIALLVNFALLTTTAVLYNLEVRANTPHTASILFGLGGLSFYFANIGSAVQSAYRYNNFQERVFQQTLRDYFFNTDTIEQVSKSMNDE